MVKRRWCLFLVEFFLILTLFTLPVLAANSYVAELNFWTSKTVYEAGERVEVKGNVFLSTFNSSGALISNRTFVTNATLNLTFVNQTTNITVASYDLNTTNTSHFSSQNDFNPSGVLILAPSSFGTYNLLLNYTDPANGTWWTQNQIEVVNESVDLLEVSTDKVNYKSNESMTITAEAVKYVGDWRSSTANVAINGTIQNSSKAVLENFSCITGSTGSCSVVTTAPATNGDYLIELNNYKAFTRINVEDFQVNVLMKDGLGKGVQYVYNTAEDASIEVQAVSYDSSEIYTFVGTVRDSGNNIVENISSTTLFVNNSFTNRYTWTLDSVGFPVGHYRLAINVTKTGGTMVEAATSFEVRSWNLVVKKAEKGSNFQHRYSAFQNETVNLEFFPTYRVNGSLIPGTLINASTDVNITLVDGFQNILGRSNASYNASCSVEGCYQFSMQLPNRSGGYDLKTTVTFDADVQSETLPIEVINTSLSAQSTNVDASLKELFGTNEFVYLTLSAKNTSGNINLTNASVISVSYMNGSLLAYSEVADYTKVNGTNGANEWAWNVTTQGLKLDTPTTGGLYSVDISADNNTVAASARFFVKPYDSCVVAKDTPGTVGASDYYAYQFTTSDTIYFEIKLYEADNPVGRASFDNTTNSSYGLGTGCVDLSTTRQVVNNATITIDEVKNIQTGKVFIINTTSSACQSDDNSGSYSCTVAPNGTWDGGNYGVKFKIVDQGETTADVAYGGFEARAFYLYAYASTWRNKPEKNVSLTIDMYEAGDNWWGNYGSGGLGGTVTLEEVEYQGRPGEWIWPPIAYDYNVSNINSTTVTNGRGTMVISVNETKNNRWQTGYYRAILKGIDDDGNVDYGYGWFEVRQWDVYGVPVDCSDTSSCSSVYNINAKDNVSLYVTITNAGEWGTSGNSLGGDVDISVKKIQDCRKWPCSNLNASYYNATNITIAHSNAWWHSSDSNRSYVIYLNTTQGSWNTGYWQVVLDVNGTETGTAWFNTIAFYAEAKPTDVTGLTYEYSIKNSEDKYFNVKTLRSQKNGYYYSSYQTADHINTTIDDLTLRTWDPTTYVQTEFNYPEDVNVSITDGSTTINGSKVINVTYTNGSNWQSGYYYGELTLKDLENQTGSAWLWFLVRPFRVALSTDQFTVDYDGCVNGSVNIYDPDWSSSTNLNGTYNITNIVERVWTGGSYAVTAYTNFTPNNTFVNVSNFSICPDTNWGAGSWGNYHYFTVEVEDTAGNKEQGWLSFRGVPYTVTWSSNIEGGTTRESTDAITLSVNLSKATSGAAATGNLTSIYQTRSDTYSSSRESYVFKVGGCSSNVSGSCNLTGNKSVTIYPPEGGWKSGYNYLYADWLSSDGSTKVTDYGSIWFNAQEPYLGWITQYNLSGVWQYEHSPGENVSFTFYTRDENWVTATVNLTKVEYSIPSSSCYSEYCRSYVSVDYNVSYSSNYSNPPAKNIIPGEAIIEIARPTANWTKGNMYVRMTVQSQDNESASKSAVIGGTYLLIKDIVKPVVNITVPVVGQNVTASSLDINWTTGEAASCSTALINFDNFYDWYCNVSYYSISGNNYCNNSVFNGTSYYYDYMSKGYHYQYTTTGSSWGYNSTRLFTGGKDHSNTYDVTELPNQDYGLQLTCYDEDWNYEYTYTAFHVNSTTSSSPVNVTLLHPVNGSTVSSSTSSLIMNYTLAGPSKANCSFYNDLNGTWLNNISSVVFAGTHSFNGSRRNNGTYNWNVYCEDTSNSTNANWGTGLNATRSNFTFTVNTSASVNVSVALVALVNASIINASEVTLNFTVNGPTLSNCDLYSNDNSSTTWKVNKSKTDIGEGTHNFNTLYWRSSSGNGSTFLWNVKCTESGNTSNVGWGGNRTFTNNVSYF